MRHKHGTFPIRTSRNYYFNRRINHEPLSNVSDSMSGKASYSCCKSNWCPLVVAACSERGVNDESFWAESLGDQMLCALPLTTFPSTPPQHPNTPCVLNRFWQRFTNDWERSSAELLTSTLPSLPSSQLLVSADVSNALCLSFSSWGYLWLLNRSTSHASLFNFSALIHCRCPQNQQRDLVERAVLLCTALGCMFFASKQWMIIGRDAANVFRNIGEKQVHQRCWVDYRL